MRRVDDAPTRADALRYYTIGSAWFSRDEDKLGSLEVGKIADLAVLSRDYMMVPVDQIGTADVLRVLTPLWATTPATASRIRGRIERILAFSRTKGWRAADSNNPALWRGHLSAALPAPRKTKAPGHHAALPYAEMPALMQRLKATKTMVE